MDAANQSPAGFEGQRRSLPRRAATFLWGLAKHPITALLAAVTVGLVTYFLSRATKEPVFVVSPPELVAQTVHGQERLRILWEDKEIQNAASVKVALWNNGSQFIDRGDVSANDPIRIKAQGKAHILAASLLRSSRSTLMFDLRKETDAEGFESAVVNIRGDEALERFDGGMFHILFSGPLEARWMVTGRIKGVPGGFQEKRWSKVHRPEDPLRRWSAVLVIVFIF